MSKKLIDIAFALLLLAATGVLVTGLVVRAGQLKQQPATRLDRLTKMAGEVRALQIGLDQLRLKSNRLETQINEEIRRELQRGKGGDNP